MGIISMTGLFSWENDKPKQIIVTKAAETSSEDSKHEQEEESTEADEVKITFEGLVSDASVKINGNPVTPPVILPKSDVAAILEVVAEGYEVFRVSVIPEADQTIPVKLKKTHPQNEVSQPSKPGKPVKRRKPKVETEEKNDEFAANPFE